MYKKLLASYLFVYLLATLSDWLQGPYVYALYAAYGFSSHQIAVLFVAGFGSSMIFGSFVGGLADSCGRKKFVLLFCLIYALSCVTKHVNDFNVLMLGRLLGGVATSLLFSVFDAWTIRAHSNANLDQGCLSNTFSYASYGNSIIAIIAGLLANRVAGSNGELRPFYEGGKYMYWGGFTAPFDVALVALLFCFIGASILWEENYGESKPSSDSEDHSSDDGRHARRSDTMLGSWKRALNTTLSNPEVLLCGIISSLFEGSMYVFVFMWTPALTKLTPGLQLSGSSSHVRHLAETSTESAASLPFGLIFSTFMVCCMAGSSTFSLAMERRVKLETLAVFIFAAATSAMALIAFSSNDTLTFVAMNIFEMTVGMYFPTMGTLKSGIVPESSRAAIYNLYRIPLNFIVLTSLLTKLSVTTSFLACALMLGAATCLQFHLKTIRTNLALTRSNTPEVVELESLTP